MSCATRAPGSPGIGAKANDFGHRRDHCTLTHNPQKVAP